MRPSALTSLANLLLIFEVICVILYSITERGGKQAMAYQELQKEYTSLLREKEISLSAFSSLKDGYISTKTISGKKYTYLQYRIGGKLKSEYIKEEYLPGIKAELEKRTGLNKRIDEIDTRLSKIEAAAGILDNSLHRRLVTLRRCAAMEAMPFWERKKSLAFGSAMTALEGIPTSRDTERNLSLWAAGDLSFQESYLSTLRMYHLTED